MKTINKMPGMRRSKRTASSNELDFTELMDVAEHPKLPVLYTKMKLIARYSSFRSVSSTRHRTVSLNNPGYYKPVSQLFK